MQIIRKAVVNDNCVAYVSIVQKIYASCRCAVVVTPECTGSAFCGDDDITRVLFFTQIF